MIGMTSRTAMATIHFEAVLETIDTSTIVRLPDDARIDLSKHRRTFESDDQMGLGITALLDRGAALGVV